MAAVAAAWPDCPAECPVGLFGATIEVLCRKENHTDMRWGRHGMVYWAHQTFLQLAALKEIKERLAGPLCPSP